MSTTEDTGDRIETMKRDRVFMAWLESQLPDWESEYSGWILFTWEAFKAGLAVGSLQ